MGAASGGALDVGSYPHAAPSLPAASRAFCSHAAGGPLWGFTLVVLMCGACPGEDTLGRP